VSAEPGVPARMSRAVVFAVVALVLLLALRAKSDGDNPPLGVVLGSFAVVVLAAWALSSRERGVFAVVAALLTTQLLLHVGYLFATTGQFSHPGGAGLFCSPASAANGSCAPTDRGGVLLLGVQLVVALVLALVLRGGEAACWRLVRRPTLAVVTALRRLLQTSAAAVLPPAVQRTTSFVAAWVPPRQPGRLLLSHECGRRGPPVGPPSSSLVAAASFS